jgi:hypothetical protein
MPRLKPAVGRGSIDLFGPTQTAIVRVGGSSKTLDGGRSTKPILRRHGKVGATRRRNKTPSGEAGTDTLRIDAWREPRPRLNESPTHNEYAMVIGLNDNDMFRFQEHSL